MGDLGRKTNFLSGKAPLSGVLVNNANGHLLDQNSYRKYCSNVTTSTIINQNIDVAQHPIMYEIGSRRLAHEDQFDISDENLRWGQTINTNDIIAQELTNLHKKQTNFTGMYEYMDLAGIAFHLARCITIYNNEGTLNCDQIRSGEDLSLRALNVSFNPVTANDACVFIPRTASMIAAPATFCALVAAANAYGSTVYTDNVEVDALNRVIIQEFENSMLVEGCYNALRILLSMYELSNEGSIIALAITRGMHRETTVVGHTDEGSYFRNILRTGDYKAPFGGIHMTSTAKYVSLPIPSRHSKSQLCACVDSILLTTAALCAISDPTVILDGKRYPTTVSSSQVAGVARQADLSTKIAAICGKYCENYIKGLCQIFGLTLSTDIAVGHLISSFNHRVNIPDRHLDIETVAPFYWIEPTTILSDNFDSQAQSSGYGVWVSVGGSKIYPALPHAEKLVNTGLQSMVRFENVTARRVPLFQHLQNHALDGNANIILSNFVEEKMLLTGGVLSDGAKRTAGTGINGYLWGRGQSSLIVPSEVMYTGQRVIARCVHSMFTNMGTMNITHIPNSDEILRTEITFRCSRPERIADGGLAVYNRVIRRNRTSAALALENAITMLMSMSITGGERFIPSNSEEINIVYEDPDRATGGVKHMVDDNVDQSENVASKPVMKLVGDAVLKPKYDRHDNNLRNPDRVVGEPRPGEDVGGEDANLEGDPEPHDQ